MTTELDIHSLPDTRSRVGHRIQFRSECNSCPFHRTIVNRDWAPGHDPIGHVCLWGSRWKWLQGSHGERKSCAKLSQPLPSESVSGKIVEVPHIALGIDPKYFNLRLFRRILDIYRGKVGSEPLRVGETEGYYEYCVQQLQRTNAVKLRLGWWGNTKFMVAWHFSGQTNGNLLYFGCECQRWMGRDHAEFLASRFDLAVDQYLQDKGIALPLHTAE